MSVNAAGKLILAAALMGALPASAYVRRAWVPVYRPWGYWYDPFYYGYGPFYYGPHVVYHPNVGEVKLDTNVKDAEVFVDGGYAGTVRKLKSMWLPPGAHDLEVRAPGGAGYAERIYVVSGKTLHVHPALEVENRP